MGENLDKKKKKQKKTAHLFFHEESIYEISILACMVLKLTYAMHNKATTLNGKKLQRAVTPTTFQLIGWKFNQVISTSVPISIPNIKALAQILFEISC